MTKMTKAEFSKAMLKLRAHYQNPVTDEGMWAASVATYWDEFKNRHQMVLKMAFDRAWRMFPEWMPSAGQLEQVISTCEKNCVNVLNPPQNVRLLQEEPACDKQQALENINKIVDNLTIAKQTEA